MKVVVIRNLVPPPPHSTLYNAAALVACLMKCIVTLDHILSTARAWLHNILFIFMLCNCRFLCLQTPGQFCSVAVWCRYCWQYVTAVNIWTFTGRLEMYILGIRKQEEILIAVLYGDLKTVKARKSSSLQLQRAIWRHKFELLPSVWITLKGCL